MGGKNKKQTSLDNFVDPFAPVARPPTLEATPRATKAAQGSSSTDEELTTSTGESLILQELKSFRSAVETQLGALTSRVDLIHADHKNLASRVTETERRIGDLEDNVTPLRQQLEDHKAEIRRLTDRHEDMEGRQRRSNVRILGMPETIPTAQLEKYMERMIPEALPGIQLSPFFVVERAHRALSVRPSPGQPPRAIILKVLNFRDRDEILKAARTQGEVRWENAKISFYPDLSPGVQRARKQFDSAKQELRRRNIQYAMLHPAKLRVQQGDQAHFFTDPRKVHDFLENLPRARSPRNTPETAQQNATPVNSEQDA